MLTMVWWCLFLTLIFSTAAGSQAGKKRSKPSSKYKFLNCVMILLWYIKLYFIWLARRTSMNSMIKYGLCLKATWEKANERKIRKQHEYCGLTAWLAVHHQPHPSNTCTMLGLMLVRVVVCVVTRKKCPLLTALFSLSSLSPPGYFSPRRGYRGFRNFAWGFNSQQK